MKSFVLAVCQNKPVYDKKKNIARALRMLDKAVELGADLLLLPEIFYFPYELARLPDQACRNEETLELLKDWAKKKGKYLCTGSLVEKRGDLFYNTAYLVDPQGRVILSYSKTHLFNVNLPGLQVKEDAVFSRGNQLAVASCELGKIGLLICYDIRFPEMARILALRGSEVILVPAAFNTVTGPAHWEIMLRARAIENQCFLAAASQARNKNSAYQAYGHSLIIDPWGRVLAEAGTGEELIFTRIDPAVLEDTRSRLPLLKHRRDDLYELKSKEPAEE